MAIKVCDITLEARGDSAQIKFTNVSEGLQYASTLNIYSKTAVTENKSLTMRNGYVLYFNNRLVANMLCISSTGAVASAVSIPVINSNGKIFEQLTIGDFGGGQNKTVSIYDDITAESSVTINTNGLVDSVSVNGISNTVFPASIKVPYKSVIDVNGIVSTYPITLHNSNNLKSVKVDETVYSNFPTTLTISSPKTLEISGKDTPEITVNYTNTKTPTIKNT